jgi:phospholipase C
MHAPDATQGQFEHSSLAATIVHKLFSPAPGFPMPEYLTKRDAWAATFESIFTSTLRADCPKHLPAIYSTRQGATRAVITPDSQITDLQWELLVLAAGVSEDASWRHNQAKQWTNRQAVKYFTEKINTFLNDTVIDLE